MEGTATHQRVSEIVSAHPQERASLIPILQDIQEALGYLSEESVTALARETGISENEIIGVGTFYTQFRFRPPGEHRVRVCLGTACHVRGGQQVLHEFEERLGIRAGETSADMRFDLERVACIGCCALAPTVVVDEEVHAGVSPRKVRALVKRYSRPAKAGEQ